MHEFSKKGEKPAPACLPTADPPQKLLNRYNEVHVVVGGKDLSEVAHT